MEFTRFCPPAAGRLRRGVVGLRAKRAGEMVLAAGGLFLLSPLLIMLALTVKITSPGPVFDVRQRLGRGGRPCRVYRFRSRVHAASAVRPAGENAVLFDPDEPTSGSPSLTSVGSFLQETQLERLPQLWNVLRGDLSL